MRTGTVANSRLYLQTRRTVVREHPLLKAFEKTQYGQLRVRLPDGQVRLFAGKESGPQAVLWLNNWNGLDALLARGEIGFAEAYMRREWDTDNLPALLTFGLANAAVLERYFYGRPWVALGARLRYLLNGNSLSGSRRNILAHYDLGNNFYRLWLDKSMTYSCALFEGKERTLEEAQAAKYNRILDKLNAEQGAHILEIGCGWGGFAEAAARRGLKVTSVTISDAQKEFAETRLRDAGIAEGQVKIELRDYRLVREQYDHIVSIGMFEHVGERYWPVYFKAVREHLKSGGKAMVQSITLSEEIYRSTKDKVSFVEYYIFPGGQLPSPRRFREEAEKAGLACKEMFAFGEDYARTLSHWLSRFEANLPAIRRMGYDEPFVRMWRFYLSCCIGAFLTGRTSVMQAELKHAD